MDNRRLAPRSSPQPVDRGSPRAQAVSAIGRSHGSPMLARLGAITRDALPLAILGGALIFVPVLIFEPQGLPRLRALERDVEQVDAENRNLEREIALTRMQVRLLKDDLPTVERYARSELGMIRKNEIVLQLPR